MTDEEIEALVFNVSTMIFCIHCNSSLLFRKDGKGGYYCDSCKGKQ